MALINAPARAALMTKPGKARRRAGRNTCRTWCQSRLKALSKISMGRKMARRSDGDMLETPMAASPSSPNPAKRSNTPQMTPMMSTLRQARRVEQPRQREQGKGVVEGVGVGVG